MPDLDRMFPDVASLEVSDRAQARIRSLLGERPGPAAPMVRLLAERSAAGALEVALGFDAPSPSDALVRLEGITLVVDPETRALCRDVHLELDYRDGSGRGFVLRGAAGERSAPVAKPEILPNSNG